MPIFRPVLYVFGLCLLAIGFAGFIPGIVDLWGGYEDYPVFFAAAAISIFIGGALSFANYERDPQLDLRQAFLLTSLLWFGLPVFAGLPFMFTATNLSLTDAYFETVSGLTTTGSTVIVGLDSLPPGVLLWRGLLQLLGGLGIVVIAIALLPFLRIGGMQMMRTESSDRSDKVRPRASQIAGSIAIAYLVLTLLCALAFLLEGLSPLDAAVNAMAALSTGGFANHDTSFGLYETPSVFWTASLFMTLGGMPMVIFVRLWQGDWRAPWKDSQVRVFIGGLLIVGLLLGLWLWANGLYDDLTQAWRHAFFNVISIVTTTGFVSTDYGLWGQAVWPLIFVLSVIGGCTGSTAGAVKIFRWQVLFQHLRRTLRRATQPHQVVRLTFNRQPITEDIIASVGLFLYLYLAILLISAVALAATGLDFVSALTGAAATLGNVGPGLGPILGPSGTFRDLNDTATWICSVNMLLGRLELLSILVLFDRRFWKG